MPFRDDILRGIRLGAILLAALLIGLTAYRMLREAPAPDTQRNVPPEQPAAPPAVAGSLQTPAIAPPPPPVRRHRATPKLAQESVPLAEADVTSAAEPTETDAISDPEKEGPDAAAEKAEADAPEPTIGVENTQKPGSRGKRWLRAIGRFLHVGPKKDLQSQAVRQP